MMTANEPTQKYPDWASIAQSGSDTGLATDFSGMNLVSSARKETGSTLGSSPASDDVKEPFPNSPANSRKAHAVPSPIGRGHSKNSSATSPLLTLTPNSSVDGNTSDNWQNRRTGGSFPDFNAEGLLAGYGSNSIRERTNSLPAFIPQDGRSNRPPLSQPSQETGSLQGDRSVGERSSSNHSHREVSLELGDSRILGSIGRPELRQNAVEFQPGRPRAASQGDGISGYLHPGSFDQSLSQKFGSLPSLTAHIQQQRMPPGHVPPPALERPHHVRSFSQPFPQEQGQFGAYGQSHSYHGGSQFIPATQAGRGGYRMPNSVPAQGFGPGASSFPTLHRRDALEYQGTPPAGFMNSVSPGHSPHQVHFGSHNRIPSDGSGLLYQSSVGSIGSTLSNQHYGHEDDMAHPLAGEHIEVPEHVEHDPVKPGPYLRSLSSGHYDAVAASSLGGPRSVYSVKFKRTQRNFVLGPRIQRDLKIGTYVKVEADRGEDLGIVVGKISAEKYSYSRSSFTAGMGPSGPAGINDLKRITRLATHDEVSLLGIKRDEEEELLKICRAKVRQRSLPMHVIDAEYQFDRHKLTFFFEAEGRVDFRELVRDLFSMYKTRIWMQQIDKNTSTAAQAMMSPPSSDVQADYGTPIIAPASEFADSVNLGGFQGGN